MPKYSEERLSSGHYCEKPVRLTVSHEIADSDMLVGQWSQMFSLKAHSTP